MTRSVLGVVLGYVTVAAFVMITFTVAFLVLGAETVFEAGSYEPSGLWILISFVLGFAGALSGGLVCAVVARNPRPPLVLAGLVLFLGLVVAVPGMLSDEPAPAVRDSGTADFEAMREARQPAWVALLNPFVGAAGILLGARLRRRSGSSASPPPAAD